MSGDPAVAAAIRDLYAAFLAGDRERFDSHLHPQLTVWETHLPGPLRDRTGLDAYRDRRDAAGTRPALSRLEPRQLRVDVWGDTATARYLLVAEPAAGGPAQHSRVTDVLRREPAGRVVALGSGVDPALRDQQVLACPTLPRGALAERVTVPADVVVPCPPELDPVAAAGLPVIYQTAWFALARARLAAGETVLVHAGAGGVGIATTQLAVARGARVICTAGGDAKTAVCRQQGAAVAIDYRSADLVAAVREATGGRGVDVVVDPVGGSGFGQSLACLAFEGRLVSVGLAAGAPPPVDPLRLVAGNHTLIGLSWGSAYPQQRPAAVAAAYRELFARHAAGAVRPPVTRVVPLEAAPAALADLAARRTTGKLVVQIGGES